MRAVDNTLALRNLADAVDENGALLLELFHHEAVVNDLLSDVDRRPERFQRDPDNIDGPGTTPAQNPRGFSSSNVLLSDNANSPLFRVHVSIADRLLSGVSKTALPVNVRG